MGFTPLYRKATYRQGRAALWVSRCESCLRLISLLAIGYKKVLDMAGYAKIWTTIYSSGSYLSLSGLERGIFLQLIILCKLHRDDGKITVENYSQLGHMLGIERRTCARVVSRLVGKMLLKLTPKHEKGPGGAHVASSSMVELPQHGSKITDKVFVIEIPKYVFWQQLRRWSDSKITEAKQENSRPRAEQKRSEQSIAEQTANLNVDNSRKRMIVEPSGNQKLDSYRQWKLDNYDDLLKLSEQYEKQGGIEWVKPHTQDIETDIIENPVKYLQIGGQKWLNWVKGWLKRSAEQNQTGNSGLKEPMSADEEEQHYKQHRDNASTRGSSDPTALGEAIKKATGE